MNALADYMETHVTEPRPHLYPVTVEAYHRMGEAGILDVTQRTELIDARIIAMAPIGTEHADRVNRLTRYFAKVLADDVTVSVQNPVYLSEANEPEPDIALLRPRTQAYREAHPRPEDVLLLIEVADTSLSYDRNVKIPLYAQHGIAECWLIDIKANRLEIFREPQDGEYRLHLKPRRDETVALFAQADIAVDLGKLF
jgi:Uma2 family endonuclease